MTDIRLDENGDISILGNELTLTDSGSESTAQRLTIKLAAIKGTWRYNESYGISYFELVFVKGTPVSLIDAEFRTAIVDTDGVAQLMEFKSRFDGATREYTIDFTVLDTEGNTVSLTV